MIRTAAALIRMVNLLLAQTIPTGETPLFTVTCRRFTDVSTTVCCPVFFDVDRCPDWGGRHPARLARAEARWLGADANHRKWPSELKRGWTAKVATATAPLPFQVTGFMHARQKSMKPSGLSTRTTKPKWRNRYAEPFKEGGGGEPHGGAPRPTPRWLMADCLR